MRASTRSRPNLFELPPDLNTVCVNKLQSVSRSGRLTSGHQERKESKKSNNDKWDLCRDRINPHHPPHPPPLCLPCGEGAPAPPPIPAPSPNPNCVDETILVSATEIKRNVEECFVCGKCSCQRIFATIQQFTSWFDAQVKKINGTLNNPPDNWSTFVLTLLKENSAQKMWKNYTSTLEYCAKAKV